MIRMFQVFAAAYGKMWLSVQRLTVAIIILLIGSSINSVVFAQWETQNSGVGVTLRGVDFVDTLRGWAVGDSATIIVTADGGATWHRQNSPVPAITLEQVRFVNKNVGYIVGQAGTILSTKDGGATWVLRESGTSYPLWDFSFVNSNTGWVVGGDPFQVPRPGVILRTSDGGRTWEKQLEAESQLFVGIKFLDADNGWAIAGDYFDNFSSTNVYRTRDGGQTWTIVGEVRPPVEELSLASDTTLWAGGFGFAISNSGGESWRIRDTISSNDMVLDIAQIDGETGWLVTASFQGKNTILFTDNGGTTWTEELVQEGPTLRAITNIGRRYLWAVGDSGMIRRYVNPNAIIGSQDEDGNENGNDELPRENLSTPFDDVMNYPNPFNTGMTIRFSLNTPQYVTLAIYDILGRKIRVLLSRTLTVGTHIVRWDGKDHSNREVPSGIYFYELRTGRHVVTKKAILLR